jgi:YbbR domain-containing protein
MRAFFSRNLGWKLLSLFLALLVYYFVHASLEGGLAPLVRSASLTFERPVTVLTSPQARGTFKVEPAVVDVTVTGRRDILFRISERELQVFVDLSDVVAANEVRRAVQIYLPDKQLRAVANPAFARVFWQTSGSPAAGAPAPGP